MRRAILRCGIVLAVLGVSFLGACLGGNLADDCHILLNCPLPDAGDAGDADATD
jgi:hypothetical protein